MHTITEDRTTSMGVFCSCNPFMYFPGGLEQRARDRPSGPALQPRYQRSPRGAESVGTTRSDSIRAANRREDFGEWKATRGGTERDFDGHEERPH